MCNDRISTMENTLLHQIAFFKMNTWNHTNSNFYSFMLVSYFDAEIFNYDLCLLIAVSNECIGKWPHCHAKPNLPDLLIEFNMSRKIYHI